MNRKCKQRGVTLIEVLLVVAILTALTAVGTGNYMKLKEQAKLAACKTMIRDLEMAATQFYVDTGQYPLSGSWNGNVTDEIPYSEIDVGTMLNYGTNHLLYAALTTSYRQNNKVINPSGSSDEAAPASWDGPYIEFDIKQLKTTGAASAWPTTSVVDPWGNMFYYVRNDEYMNGSSGSRWGQGRNPLDSTNNDGNEIWYHNPKTFQIWTSIPEGNSVYEEDGLVSNFADTYKTH